MNTKSVHKQAFQVFDSWQLKQDVFGVPAGNSTGDQTRLQHYYQKLRDDYHQWPGALAQLEAVMGWFEQGKPMEIQKFVHFLEKNNFCNRAAYQEELSWSIHKIIKKYNAFMRLLCADMSRERQKRFLYALAHDMFYFCFESDPTYIDKLVATQKLQPLIRMLYALMWVQLGARGWQSWNQQVLDDLKKIADHGSEVVYIAGGSDIHQLLKHGIYNIRVIDPFLSTQDTYYSRGWKFLVQGSLGDTIEWVQAGQTLMLKRAAYKEHRFFTAHVSGGRKRRIPNATIVWDIYDSAARTCGQLTIERRFTTQEDFSYSAARCLLISFNELYFVTTAQDIGWGIDLKKLDKRCKLYVKQLQYPLSKKVLTRIQQLDKDFEFIQLGNCID